MFSKHPPFLWNKPSHLICNLSVFYYFYAINKTVTTMIYRFTIISDEVDDFVREIQIDPEATFFDLHEAILKAANYTNDQMTSFFICDDDWEKEKEITLEEMDNNPEMDSWIMKETRLNELIEDVLRNRVKPPSKQSISKRWQPEEAHSIWMKTSTVTRTSIWKTLMPKDLM